MLFLERIVRTQSSPAGRDGIERVATQTISAVSIPPDTEKHTLWNRRSKQCGRQAPQRAVAGDDSWIDVLERGQNPRSVLLRLNLLGKRCSRLRRCHMARAARGCLAAGNLADSNLADSNLADDGNLAASRGLTFGSRRAAARLRGALNAAASVALSGDRADALAAPALAGTHPRTKRKHHRSRKGQWPRRSIERVPEHVSGYCRATPRTSSNSLNRRIL